MAETSIEWATDVWNPTTGCDRVSPGCDHCYALTLAKRLKGMGSAKYQRDGDPRTSGPGFGITTHADALGLPLSWKRSRRVFVNSMSDLFHDDIPDEFIAQVFAVMARAPQHTYQVLTKRHGRMRSLLGDDGQRLLSAAPDEDTAQALYEQWPLPNIWLGVSVETQQWADIRIPALLDTPAAVRWLSCEPLLGPVDLLAYVSHQCDCPGPGHNRLSEYGPRVDWVVAGGESGPGARPMDLPWAQELVDQCRAAGVAAFVKQLGSRWGKNHHDVDAFPEPLRVREYPAGAR